MKNLVVIGPVLFKSSLLILLNRQKYPKPLGCEESVVADGSARHPLDGPSRMIIELYISPVTKAAKALHNPACSHRFFKADCFFYSYQYDFQYHGHSRKDELTSTNELKLNHEFKTIERGHLYCRCVF